MGGFNGDMGRWTNTAIFPNVSRGSMLEPLPGMHDKEAKPWQDAAKQEYERFKERRNPSADVHGEPMSGGKPPIIVASWTWAIRYRPSLGHRLALTCHAPRKSQLPPILLSKLAIAEGFGSG